MLLNAVNYMSLAAASYPAVVLSQSPLVYYRFNDLVRALPPVVATNSGALGVPGNGLMSIARSIRSPARSRAAEIRQPASTGRGRVSMCSTQA